MYVGSNIHINAIEQSRASDKVAHILMYVAMQFGAISNDKVYQVDVKLSQQQFANMVGLARETTTIEFGKLKKKGIVEYSGGIYKIHLARLQELLGEDDVRTINLQ